MAKTTSFALGKHFDDFLRDKIESGRYSSASEVVREALRLLEQRDRRREALNQALLEGEASGEPITHDDTWARLEDKHPWLKK
jgi:antitoxin ParD1/3/4